MGTTDRGSGQLALGASARGRWWPAVNFESSHRRTLSICSVAHGYPSFRGGKLLSQTVAAEFTNIHRVVCLPPQPGLVRAFQQLFHAIDT